jgi:hypothetical protein
MSDIYNDLSSTTRTGQQVISPGAGAFGWLKSTYRLTDEQVYEACGLDAAMYTMLYRAMFWLFAVCGVYSMAILLPINAYGRTILLSTLVPPLPMRCGHDVSLACRLGKG